MATAAAATGFAGAPVSKGIVAACSLASIVYQATKARASPPTLPFAKALVFRSPGELVFGCFLLYCFRILERQWGSSKFGSFALICSALTVGIQSVAARLLPPIGPIPTGPYGLLFASFVHFFLNIPASSKFVFLGLKLNDKTFIYLAGLQLLLTGGLPCVVAGAAGVVAGLVYRTNLLGIRKWRLPGFINTFIARTLGPLLSSGSQGGVQVAPGRRQRSSATSSGSRNSARRAGGAGGAAVPSAAAAEAAVVVQIPPEYVDQLEQMGFSRPEAQRALQATRGDVNAAISLLLGS